MEHAQDHTRASSSERERTGASEDMLVDVDAFERYVEVQPTTAGDRDIFGRVAPKGGNWSHRRGEPRIFAFCWTFYLLLATLGAFWSIGAPGTTDAGALRLASRSLLAAMSVGLVILWPMLRLSQSRLGSGSVREAALGVGRDLLVLLIPAQAIIWPQIVMAGWPVNVVGALSAGLVAWTLLVGGLLVIARASRKPGPGVWMVFFVLIAAVGPLAALGPIRNSTPQPDFGWWWMTSPITTGFELTRDRLWSGASAAITSGHWKAIGLVGAAGGGLWLVVLALGLSGRDNRA